MENELICQLIIWSVIFMVCIIIEIITLGLTTIWFAGGALVSAISVFFGTSLIIQILIFAVISLAVYYKACGFKTFQIIRYGKKQMLKVWSANR